MKQYSYDAQKRLKKVTLEDHKETYIYDMFDKVISKQHVLCDNDDVLGYVNYLYDNEDIIREYNSNGIHKDTVHGLGIDNPLWSIDPNNTVNNRYYTQDILGSIINLTDNNGNITDTYNYKAFGKMDHKQVIPTDNYYGEIHYGYTGRTYNDINDLMDYRSRQYDPHLGQFTQYDSNISESLYQSTDYLEPNIYSHFNYANNNPLTFNDPLGKCFFPIFLEEDYMPPYRPDYAKGLDPNKTPVNVNPNLTNVWQIFKDRWITWLNDKANITVWRWNRRFIPDENKYTPSSRNEMSDGDTPFYYSDGYPSLSSASTPDPNKGLNDDEENEEAKPLTFITHGIASNRTWMKEFGKKIGGITEEYKWIFPHNKWVDWLVVLAERPLSLLPTYESDTFAHIIKVYSQMHSNKTILSSINIVAHSGGGQVSFNAAEKLSDSEFVINNLFLMGAPVRKWSISNIDTVWDFYSDYDPFFININWSDDINSIYVHGIWHIHWPESTYVHEFIKKVIH